MNRNELHANILSLFSENTDGYTPTENESARINDGLTELLSGIPNLVQEFAGIEVGEPYRHQTSGKLYTVVGFSNTSSDRDKFPPTVIYTKALGEDTYSRSVDSFTRSFEKQDGTRLTPLSKKKRAEEGFISMATARQEAKSRLATLIGTGLGYNHPAMDDLAVLALMTSQDVVATIQRAVSKVELPEGLTNLQAEYVKAGIRRLIGAINAELGNEITEGDCQSCVDGKCTTGLECVTLSRDSDPVEMGNGAVL